MSDPGFTVTLKDVYLLVQEVKEKIAPLPSYGTKIDDHETRMRSLERWRYGIPAGLLITAGNILYTWISTKGH